MGNNDELKRQEAAVDGDDGSRPTDGEPSDLSALRHERRVLGLELELQNEELQRAHAELEAARRRYFELFDRAPLAYLVVDEMGLVHDANRIAGELFGVDRASLVGSNIASHLHPDIADIFYTNRQRALSSGERVACEFELARPGARPLSCHLETSVCDAGEGLCFTAIVDVSDRKQMEHDIARSQRLEAIGRLASGVAHDFNNLLMGLGGCADIALSQIDPQSPARMYLDEIRRATSEGAAIAGQLLAFARDRGDAVQTVGLDQAVASSASVLRHLIGEDVKVRVALDAARSQITLPPGRVEQILLNLGANARDAMPAGGVLTIETEREVIDSSSATQTRPAGEYAVLRVGDTGTGMDEHTRDRALEPFFTTKGPSEGTGLGLATVYAAVARSGGWIDLDSEPGRGTTVTLFFPSRRETVEAPAEKAEPAPATGSGTILLTEDEALVRMVVRYYLEDAGYRVLEADSAEEALECFRRFPGTIHLLLTDIVLPGISGSELAETLTALSPELGVVYMSAHAVDERLRSGRVGAPAAALAKPFTREQLLERVTSALR